MDNTDPTQFPERIRSKHTNQIDVFTLNGKLSEVLYKLDALEKHVLESRVMLVTLIHKDTAHESNVNRTVKRFNELIILRD